MLRDAKQDPRQQASKSYLLFWYSKGQNCASRSALLVTKWTKAISFIKGGSDTRSGSMGKTGKDF
jgi:hypothetical protein